MTREEATNAIKKCRWLSDNMGKTYATGICRLRCLPCSEVVVEGECETLIDLFSKNEAKS